MSALTEALNGVIEKLKGAGISSVSTDTSDLQPPCVWIAGDTLVPGDLKGSWEVRLSLILIVRNANVQDSLEQLKDLLARVSTEYDPDGPIEIDSAVEMANGAILPAFRYPLHIPVKGL